MKIPKYDIKNKKDNEDFKQIEKYMPENTFRMLLCGNSGCGKTNTLCHMILKPLLLADRYFLYGKNLDQNLYKNLIEIMNDISKKKDIGYKILICNNDKIIPLEDMENNLRKVIIFDDLVCEKNQKPINKYFMLGRHKNCSIIYLSQSFFDTPKSIRINCSHYCIFTSSSNMDKNLISKELGVNKEQIDNATDKEFNFLYVDKPKKSIKKNFDENI